MSVKEHLSKPGTLLRLTCIFWLIAKLISYKVWLADRVFPLVPVFNIFGAIPPYIHQLLFALSLLLITTLIIRPQSKPVMYLLLVSELVSVLTDYTRWQPWEYQYLCILLIYILITDGRQARQLLLFLIAAIYFYSGLHKINEGFLHQVWNNMILMSFLKVPHSVRANDWVHYGGYIIAVIEAIAGIALLVKPLKKPAALFLIAMHLFNLVWLGPVGMNYNIVVWPWNILMISLLYLLFVCKDSEAFSFRSSFKLKHAFILIPWGLLPLFNLWGYWDHYLSGSLYSGKLQLMAICINSDKAKQELAPYIVPHDIRNRCSGLPLVKLQSWAMKEMNVPPYPEARVYLKINKILKDRYQGCEAYLYYFSSPEQIHID